METAPKPDLKALPKTEKLALGVVAVFWVVLICLVGLLLVLRAQSSSREEFAAQVTASPSPSATEWQGLVPDVLATDRFSEDGTETGEPDETELALTGTDEVGGLRRTPTPSRTGQQTRVPTRTVTTRPIIRSPVFIPTWTRRPAPTTNTNATQTAVARTVTAAYTQTGIAGKTATANATRTQIAATTTAMVQTFAFMQTYFPQTQTAFAGGFTPTHTSTPMPSLTPTQTATFEGSIVFSADSDSDGFQEILRESAGGGTTTVLTNPGDGNAMIGDWLSPSIFVYTQEKDEGLTKLLVFGPSNVEIPVEPEGINNFPVWSPDTAWIAFINETSHCIYAYDDDTDPHLLYELSCPGAGLGQLDWSADGSRLVFIQNGDIYLLDVSQLGTDPGGTYPEPTLLRNEAFDLSWPRINGSRLLYQGQNELYLANLAGDAINGTPATLTDGLSDPAAMPSWSPDGVWAVFVRGGSQTDLAFINVSTKEVRTVSNASLTESYPIWIP